jgi:hypothetical protein
MRLRSTFLSVLLVATVLVPAAHAQSTIFKFESDEFWLNLHKFLYVLGQAQNKDGNASRAAVAGAPADAERGLASLTDAERRTWTDAVSAYARGLSRQDPIRDRDLALLEGRLADVDDAGNVAGAMVDESLRTLLEGAAPVYRKAWWSSHRAANRAFVSSTQQLLAAQGPAVLQFITRAYQMPWPAGGYPVHATAYAHWAGAYSTWGNLLIVSTNTGAGSSGWAGLESVFHESMHQWDDQVDKLLTSAAAAAGGRVAFNLSHALVFYTAGEAVRRVAPAGYVPYAESGGVWQRGMQALKTPIEEIWLPYLNGRGSRDEAIAALVRRTLAPQPRAAIFTFQTDDFWLNLHHFLYAAGVIEAKLPEASQAALAPAGSDMQRGLERLDTEQRGQWVDIVSKYAQQWSRTNPQTEPAANIVRALSRVDETSTLAAIKIDPELRSVLELAAPIYRAAWWTAHRNGNRMFRSQVEALVARHGERVRDYLTRAFAIEWPGSGRVIRVTSYANFAGAYSLVNGGLIIVSSTTPSSQGLPGLETLFHESMHQWDPQTFGALVEQAKKINVRVPQDLPHAMIFLTVGDAVKSVAPDYVPLVETLGIWQLRLSGASLPASRLRQPLLDTWKPYLDGRGTREEALAALVARAAAASQ